MGFGEKQKSRKDGGKDGDKALIEEEDTLIDEAPPRQFADLEDDGDASPDDRRRDPLRHTV